MFILKIIFFVLILSSPSFSKEKNIPTYNDFLELFPNGYPKYSSRVGNSKSIGAYQEYLDEIGFMTINAKDKKIGFKVIFDKDNSVNLSKLKDYNKKDFILWGSLIHKKISQNLIYPPKAKNRNISGKVHVYLSIKASGEILNKYITVSSGYKSLDNSVLNALKNIMKMPEAPFENNKTIFDVIIPVNFKIE